LNRPDGLGASLAACSQGWAFALSWGLELCCAQNAKSNISCTTFLPALLSADFSAAFPLAQSFALLLLNPIQVSQSSMGSRRVLLSSVLAFIAAMGVIHAADVPVRPGHQATASTVGAQPVNAEDRPTNPASVTNKAADTAVVKPAAPRNQPADSASVGEQAAVAENQQPALRHNDVHETVDKADAEADANMETAYYSGYYDYRYCYYWYYGNQQSSYCGYLNYQPSCCGSTSWGENQFCNAYNQCESYQTYENYYCSYWYYGNQQSTYCGYLDYEPSCCGSTCCAEGYHYCNSNNECAMYQNSWNWYYCGSTYCGYLDYQPTCCGNTCCSSEYDWCNAWGECEGSNYYWNPTMQPTHMSRDAKEKMRHKIGKSASDNALAKTMHKSGVFVANAIRSAGLDFPERYDVQPGEFSSLLEQSGFVWISKLYKHMDGDVAVWTISDQHKHGHVQVYFNGKWFSDFAQEHLKPWYDTHGSTVIYYRYGSE
jgi:hypothetical protein